MKATNIIELEFNNQDERTAYMNAQANNIKHYATYVKGEGWGSRFSMNFVSRFFAYSRPVCAV